MTLTVTSLALAPGDDLYYNPGFRTVLETHMNILRMVDAVQATIPNDKVYQYEGNFYGYLNELGVVPYLHWIYLRVNGFENPSQFGEAMRDPYNREVNEVLITPSMDLINRIRALYLTKRN